MAKQFTLGKDERLKSRKAIEQLFKEGKSFVVTPFRVHYVLKEEVVLQFGIGVSSRNFKRAVDRNRIKRLSREAWRLQKNDLKKKLSDKKSGLQIFLVFTGKEIPDHSTVTDKVQIILNKLIKRIHETDPSNS